LEGVELHVALEEAVHLVGARLSRVHQIGDILILRTFSPSAALALDPGGKAFHLTALRPPTPQAPPAFCQLVRRLRGQPITAMEQAGYDRVLRLRFPEADLVVDLRPRQGEIFVHWSAGGTHALRGSEPRPANFDSTGSLDQGVGPELRRAAQAAGLSPEELARRALAGTARGYLYATPRGRLASFFPRPDLGEPLEEAPAYRQVLDQLLEARLAHPSAQRTKDQLRTAIERRKRALQGLEHGRAEAERWQETQYRADLILARLSDIPHGEAQAEVEDFDGSPITIPLDPTVPPVVHAQALYRRARKLRRRLEHLPRRRAELQRELAKLEHLHQGLTQHPDLAPYLEEELGRLGERKHGSQTDCRQKPSSQAQPREIPLNGFTVRIGRSARENEALVRRARDEDLWLHARGVPGAHVLISTGGRNVPADVLHKAAELAAWHSQARGERKVQVSYTEARYLRKPKGAAPGTVRLLQENVLWVPGDKGT